MPGVRRVDPGRALRGAHFYLVVARLCDHVGAIGEVGERFRGLAATGFVSSRIGIPEQCISLAAFTVYVVFFEAMFARGGVCHICLAIVHLVAARLT